MKRSHVNNYYWAWNLDFWIALLASLFWMPSNYYTAWYFVSSWMIIGTVWWWSYNVYSIVILVELLLVSLLLAVLNWFRRRHYWMDPTVVFYSKEDEEEMTNFGIHFYSNEEEARIAACHYHHHSSSSSTITNLNTSCHWEFSIFSNVSLALSYANHGTMTATGRSSNRTWEQLVSLPHVWTLPKEQEEQQRVNPMYTNIRFPFRSCWLPSLVPIHKNPTGVYRTTIPAHILDYDETVDYYVLTCHGMLGAASWIFLNGTCIGYWTDDHLSASFRIPTRFFSSHKKSTNTLLLVNALFGSASYLQDQDQWWMAGMNTKLTLRPHQNKPSIQKYHIQTHSKSKQITINVTATTTTKTTTKTTTTNHDENYGSLVIEAKLYQDVQTCMEGGCQMGPLLWSTTSHSLPNIHYHVDQDMVESFLFKSHTNLPIKLWSAETPQLYTLILVLKQQEQNGLRILQIESCRVGFRTVDITPNGILTLNDQPITICGINRHEFHPRTGKIMTLPLILQDVSLLKQNNFNAIRCSHYPNVVEFYQICDYMGMYVVDEANVESHGVNPLGRLAMDICWRKSIQERILRMVQRDINFACILIWSLGNESGQGWNFSHARNKILSSLDNSRPIQYEGGGSLFEGTGTTKLTDIICPMYTSVKGVQQLLGLTPSLSQNDTSSNDDQRPIILCEYSHAMGNSNGNVDLYWKDLFWNNNIKRCQGGFLWDMIDQGLSFPEPSKCGFFGYGGDFSHHSRNDFQFCLNGLFSPNRKPHPAVEELKYCQQPVSFTLINDDDCHDDIVALEVKSRYAFLSHEEINDIIEFYYTLSSYNKTAPTTISFVLPSNQSKLIKFSIPQIRDYNATIWLNITGSLKSSTSWAPKGHILIREQLKITNHTTIPIHIHDDESSGASSLLILKRETDDKLSLYNHEKKVAVWDVTNGSLLELNKVQMKLESNLTRAVIDNDRGGYDLLQKITPSWMSFGLFFAKHFNKRKCSYAHNWTNVGLIPNNLITKTIEKYVEQTSQHLMQIKFECEIQTKTTKKVLFHQYMTYTFDGIANTIRLQVRIVPTKIICRSQIGSLPRIGLTLKLSASPHPVIQYFGRGPHENYPDRKSSAHMDWYECKNSTGYNDYIVPGENGNRTDCRHVVIHPQQDTIENKILHIFTDDESFHFSALPFSQYQYHIAKHNHDFLLSNHENDMNYLYVNIDSKLMGLGGDVGWYPSVYPQYRISPKEKYEYTIQLKTTSTKNKQI